jgi:hypothetical protein
MLKPRKAMELTQKTRIKACQTRMGMALECLGWASDTYLASGLLTYPGVYDRVLSLWEYALAEPRKEPAQLT